MAEGWTKNTDGARDTDALKIFEDRKNLLIDVDAFKKSGNDVSKVISNIQNSSTDYENLANLSKKLFPDGSTKDKIQEYQNEYDSILGKLKDTDRAAISNRADNSTQNSTSAQNHCIRCIYAGMVIKNTEHCRYPNALNSEGVNLAKLKFPNEMNINKNDFRCSIPAPVMCSPLLFGVTAQNKPFCIEPSKNATADCIQLVGASEQSIKTTLAIWDANLTENPPVETKGEQKSFITVLNEDISSLCENKAKLCGAKKGKNDIRMTCAKVKERLEVLRTKSLPANTATESSKTSGSINGPKTLNPHVAN